jgi:hypothetical protein
MIRDWLCSAFRAEQPQPPASGVPSSPFAHQNILASFRHPAKAASVPASGPGPGPIPTLAGGRIHLKVRRLHTGARITALPAIRVTHLSKKPLQMRHPEAIRIVNPGLFVPPDSFSRILLKYLVKGV